MMVLRAIKHHEFSVLLYNGGIKCSRGFEPLAPWRHDGVGRKPRPFPKRRSKRNGGKGGEGDEKHQGNSECPCRAGCEKRYVCHSRNSFPYDRTGTRWKRISAMAKVPFLAT